MSAARFAELVEQFQPFPIRHDVTLSLQTLEIVLSSEREWEDAKEPASSISFTSLLISGSETNRNWKREVIRGRNPALERRRPPVLMSGNLQLPHGFRLF